jgi:hypothetical protein
MAFVGERQGAHGGVEPGVAEGAWDEAEVAASFEQRGGVSMPAGLQSNTKCGNSGALFGCTAGALGAGSAPGRSGARHVFVIAPGGGEAPGVVTGCCPIMSQKAQSVLRPWDVAVLGALPSVDMDHLRWASIATP